ncbi:hypothetical protein Pint_14861 [Pistacia integerrima]|uniref:Uncharacterized protein n=1 Tax=Pistacia integerrima TaxID=434235 RepID=A0ACC0ZF80_9ROSI|nr:hypothetical protein Pint_14861 [Pistacia integerrima]
MGRAPCCAKVGLYRGPWSVQEDALLVNYIRVHGEGHWRNLPKNAASLQLKRNSRRRTRRKRLQTKRQLQRTKVYLPKAVKVSPYFHAISNMGFENVASGSSSLSSLGEDNIVKADDPEVALNDSPAPCWPPLIEEEEEANNAHMNEECYSLTDNNACDNSFLNFLDGFLEEYDQDDLLLN